MKPIKIIISAFGPYADTMPAIEFEKFEEKGLFLISGDTGAGKTTIFDAICFVLYGCASGSHRDNKNFRSEYAKDSTESFVDFYFSHQGRNYNIKRWPQYTKIKKNGNGTTTESERVILYCEGETPVEGSRAVSSAILELLKIDDKQFKQIAMIAQGEFWDLLNAPTAKRTEILRTIFMTDGYKQIEALLADRKKANGAKLTATENSVIQYFDDVEAGEDSELLQQLELLQERADNSKSAWNLNEIIEIIMSILKEDAQALELIGSELKTEEAILKEKNDRLATANTDNGFITRLQQLQEEKVRLDELKSEMDSKRKEYGRKKDATHVVKPEYDKWQAKIRDISTSTENLSITEKELDDAKQCVKEAEKVLAEALTHEEEIRNLQANADRLKKDESKYGEREACKAQMETLKTEEEKNSAQAKLLEKEQEELKTKIEKLKGEVTALSGAKEDSIRLGAELDKLVELTKNISDIIENAVPQYRDKQSKYAELQGVYEEAQSEASMRGKLVIDAEELLGRCRAGLIAKERLKAGAACPVCGSTTHPSPAKLPHDNIDEEAVKRIKEEHEIADRAKNKALEDVTAAKTAFESARDYLEDEMVKCLENELYNQDCTGRDVEELYELIVVQKNVMDSNIADKKSMLEKALADAKMYDAKSEEYEKARGEETDKLAEQAKTLDEKKDKNNELIAELKGKLQSFDELEFAALNEAVAAREKQELKAKELNQAIVDAREAKEKAEKEKSSLKASCDTIADSLKKQKQEEGVLLKKYEDAMKAKAFESEEVFLEYVTDESKLEELDTLIKKYDTEVGANAAQLEAARTDAQGKVWTEIDELSAEASAQKEKVDILSERKNALQYRIQSNKSKLDNIKAKQTDLEAYRKEDGICNRLYNLVTGQTGKGKITLEQYIQAAGFDGIIRAANRRLHPMSEGQYELYRQEDSLGKRSNTFLDLEVLDNFTGHRRPVGNLSGGESFKASLSLALGLSDTVSSNIGGVQMDALFVDEGFGTLDKKSIDSAMDILINLSSTSKLVGIISHREELMENIPQQIRITKDKSGSHISVDTGV